MKRVILSIIQLTAAVSVSAGLLGGLLDSSEVKAAKKNDAWYAANKDKINVKLENFTWYTNEASTASIELNGTVENLSDDKISSVVIDFIITNQENKQEALRERMKIAATVFKSETHKLPRLFLREGESDLVKCLNRIKDISWSYQVVTVIGEGSGMSSGIPVLFPSDNYYKIRSFWMPAEK